jgi:hypothetical protein
MFTSFKLKHRRSYRPLPDSGRRAECSTASLPDARRPIPQRKPIEYENAQKRILEVFEPWKAPANFKTESFVIRVGDWRGYTLMECDDPLEVHKFCSMLPAFTFEARPVVAVADAIRVELEAMANRDGLRGNDTQLD